MDEGKNETSDRGSPSGAAPPLRQGGAPPTNTTAVVLAFVFPFGVHRWLLGFREIAIAQAVLTVLTCGLGGLWSWRDGVLILLGRLGPKDGQALREGDRTVRIVVPMFLISCCLYSLLLNVLHGAYFAELRVEAAERAVLRRASGSNAQPSAAPSSPAAREGYEVARRMAAQADWPYLTSPESRISRQTTIDVYTFALTVEVPHLTLEDAARISREVVDQHWGQGR